MTTDFYVVSMPTGSQGTILILSPDREIEAEIVASLEREGLSCQVAPDGLRVRFATLEQKRAAIDVCKTFNAAWRDWRSW